MLSTTGTWERQTDYQLYQGSPPAFEVDLSSAKHTHINVSFRYTMTAGPRWYSNPGDPTITVSAGTLLHSFRLDYDPYPYYVPGGWGFNPMFIPVGSEVWNINGLITQSDVRSVTLPYDGSAVSVVVTASGFMQGDGYAQNNPEGYLDWIKVQAIAPEVTVTAHDPTLSEAADLANTGSLRVRRSGAPMDIPLRVTLKPDGGTATLFDDYWPATIVDIPIGLDFLDVPIEALDDTTWEPTETITFDADASPAEARYLAPPTPAGGRTFNLLDDELLFHLDATDDTTSEDGDPAVIHITADKVAARDTPIEIQLVADTGGSGDIGSVSATMPKGARTVDVEVKAVEDAEIEPREKLKLTVKAPHTGEAAINIADNDFKIIAAEAKFDSQGVKQDTGQQQVYASPQWLDANGDTKDENGGPANDTIGFPISYPRSVPAGGGTPSAPRKVIATPEFRIEFKDINVLAGTFRIDGAGGGIGGGKFVSPTALNIAQDPAAPGEAVVTGALPSDANLPETIDNGELSVNWKLRRSVTVNNNVVEQEKTYGTTKNHIYVTGVAAPDQFETVLQLGCEGAKGKRPRNPGEVEPTASQEDQKVIDGVWSKFAEPALSVPRAADGEIMRYWGPISSQEYADADRNRENFTIAGLLKHADGRCNAWAELLKVTLAVHGIDSNIRGILAQEIVVDGHGVLDEDPWTLDKEEAGKLTSPYGSALYVRDIPAQGGRPLQRLFSDHVVVEVMGATILDPSYGVRVAGNDLNDALWHWEERAIEDFYYDFKGSNGQYHLYTWQNEPWHRQTRISIPIPLA